MNEADQVLRLYETGLKDIPTLAKAMTMSDLDVHKILFERSAEYRSTLQGAVAESGDKAEEMMNIIVDVARTSSSPHARLRAAMFVRDDLKGRRDEAPADKGLNVEVVDALAKRIAALNANRQRFLQNAQPVIDVG